MYIEGVWLAFIDFPSNWTPINVYISRIYNMPWHEAWWRNNFQLFEWLAIDIRLRSVFPPFFFFFWFDKFDISILPGFQFNAFCGGTLWSGGATFLALSFNEWMNEPVFSTRGANASQNVFKRVADHYIEYGSRQRISQWKFRVNLKVPSDFQTCNWHTESGHSMQFSHTKLMIP